MQARGCRDADRGKGFVLCRCERSVTVTPGWRIRDVMTVYFPHRFDQPARLSGEYGTATGKQQKTHPPEVRSSQRVATTRVSPCDVQKDILVLWLALVHVGGLMLRAQAIGAVQGVGMITRQGPCFRICHTRWHGAFHIRAQRSREMSLKRWVCDMGIRGRGCQEVESQ